MLVKVPLYTNKAELLEYSPYLISSGYSVGFNT